MASRPADDLSHSEWKEERKRAAADLAANLRALAQALADIAPDVATLKQEIAATRVVLAKQRRRMRDRE